MKKNLDKKLALNEKVDKSYEQMLEFCRNAVLKMGRITDIFIMRNLKVTRPMACRILKDLGYKC